MQFSKTEAIEEAMLYIEAINVLHRARPHDANEELIDALRVQIEKIVGVTFLGAMDWAGVFPKAEPQVTVSP